jgi:hypothetical protein
MAANFQEFIKSDRKRLSDERKAIVAQQREVEKKLASIDRELAAIAAYQSAKTGKAAPVEAVRKPRRATGKRRGVRARSGSRRESIIAALQGTADGLSRGELLEKMELKGDKAGEMSVSNALTALTKSKQLVRKDKKYLAPTS